MRNVMMWWAWTWLTRWWATNPSRELIPLPMCLQTCERMKWQREGKHLSAAGTSYPTIQCVNFLRQWASKQGFPTLATVQLCMLPKLVSASVTDQFGARCAPRTSQGSLWRVRGSWFTSAASQWLFLWATCSPTCSSLNKMKRMLRIEQLGW